MKQPSNITPSSKARLLAHASAHLKTHGFAASPVDAVAKQAGMTSGAVYQHFAGKADLFAAVIEAELQNTRQRFSTIAAHDAAGAEKALNKYVSQAHVDKPEAGCPLPSLTAEVARGSDAVKLAYQNGLLDTHHQLSRITGSPQTAWALIAQSVGAVMLARAMSDNKLQSDLLRAVKAHSVGLLNAPVS
jgi:TetR/AcrR family transcriptional regulator, transcriptional repressor for nem operon